MSESLNTVLTTDAPHALFRGEISGLIVTVYKNERPLCGLSGLIDWNFHGALSRCVKEGVITGAEGECTYFPLRRHGSVFHLILAGVGYSESPGERHPPPGMTLKALRRNLISLKLSNFGVSKADFGNVENDYFLKNLKDIPLWIAP